MLLKFCKEDYQGQDSSLWLAVGHQLVWTGATEEQLSREAVCV